MYIFAGYGSRLTFPRCALSMLDKEEKYKELFPVVQALMAGEDDDISCMANLSSLLHNEFGFWWTGFYRVSHSGNLDLGPFQGPLACTKIAFGKGGVRTGGGTRARKALLEVLQDATASRSSSGQAT